MIQALNNYLCYHGKQPVNIDRQQNGWCDAHCWAMIRAGNLYHTESCYLQDWAEIVAMCNLESDWGRVEEHLINIIDSSEQHRTVLLNASVIGYSVIAFRWNVYLTIRAK
jgi:hypothetical protein